MKKAIGFYYGSCLLLTGLVLGMVLGTSMGGMFLFGEPATVVIIILTLVGIVGLYIDWNDKLKRY